MPHQEVTREGGLLSDKGPLERIERLSGASPLIHDDLVVLTRWLVDRGYSARTVADSVEKPWHWARELCVAWATLDHEFDNPCGDAYVVPGEHDLYAYCAGTKPCGWSIDLRDAP